MVLQKKSLRITTAVLLVVALAVTLCSLIGCSHFSNPFHRSDTYIKNWIKEELPVGTDKETVRAWLAEYPELETEEYDGGYSSYYDYTLTKEERDAGTIVGVTRISASYSYTFIFNVDLLIYFGFDENDCLVDVGVKSDADTL